MILYLTRHGQSQGNADGFFQGKETPLSPLGEVQAARLAERLKQTKIDEIWVSHMQRAKHTAQIINQFQNAPLAEMAELEELKRPSVFEGKSWDDPEVARLKKTLGMGRSVAPTTPQTKFEDGESVAEFLARIQKVMSKIEAKARAEAEDFTLCVTSHGYVTIALFIIATLGEQATPQVLQTALSTLKHENTGLTVMHLSKKQETKVLTFNDFSHL